MGMAVAATLAWAGAYAGVAKLVGGIGGGDVKLAVPLGVACWWAGGAGGLLAAMCAASLLSIAGALLAGRRRVPHGPSMVLAAAAVCVLCASVCDT